MFFIEQDYFPKYIGIEVLFFLDNIPQIMVTIMQVVFLSSFFQRETTGLLTVTGKCKSSHQPELLSQCQMVVAIIERALHLSCFSPSLCVRGTRSCGP